MLLMLLMPALAMGVPTNTGPPTITGTPQVGRSVELKFLGAWNISEPETEPILSVTWEDCDQSGNCSPISGAPFDSYLLQSSDLNFYIRAVVTAENEAGKSSPASSNEIGPVAAAEVSTPPSGPREAPPPIYIPPMYTPPTTTPPTFSSTPTCDSRDPKNAGIFVHLYSSSKSSSVHGFSSKSSSVHGLVANRTSPKAVVASTSEKGWQPHQCLKMDKGPAGRSHTIVGVRNLHNWLLGGYGNDTIIGGQIGDVIWGDYQPSGEPKFQTATIHAGNGRNVIYANDTVNYVWTGTNPKTIVHAHENSGVIHCQNPHIVLYTSHGALPHFKLDGCKIISFYSVGY